MRVNKGIRFLVLWAAVLACGDAVAAHKTADHKTVDTPKQALAIGMKVCDQSWGVYKRSQGQPWKLNPKQWNAKLDGDHWLVWMGDEQKPSMHIRVAHDGTPPNVRTDCILTFRE
jgi:hypothetical protein